MSEQSKIILYGAGHDVGLFFKRAGYCQQIFNDLIVAVVDSDRQKAARKIGGIKIMLPQDMDWSIADKIIISSSAYEEEIRHFLLEKHDVSGDKIINLKTYIKGKIIQYQYEMNLQKYIDLPKTKKSCTNDMVVYTAIIGDYDELKEPLVVEPGVKYVCFTDQRKIKSVVWEVIYVQAPLGMTNEMFVRDLKLRPHKLFPECNLSVWVDASLQLVGSIRMLIKKYMRGQAIMLFPHMDRICIYEEAAVCLEQMKADKYSIIKQVNKYYNQGYPMDNGLFCGGCLVRRHNDSVVINAMEEWYKEVRDGSCRDQISLAYVLWKTGLSYSLTDINIFENDIFKFNNHKKMNG